MSEIASRELRNDTAGVLRRVEAGERVTITVNAGALVATDVDTRAARMATVQAMADIEVLPIDEPAVAWARLRVHLAESGRRVNVNDLWSAAVASSRDLPLYTQDEEHEDPTNRSRAAAG